MGFGIISFNSINANSSIKYEYYNLKSNLKKDVKIEPSSKYTIYKMLNNNNDDNFNNKNDSLIDRFWILFDENNNNKLIIKNIYTLSDFNNLFGGPFDTQIEVIQFLENFKDVNYEIVFQ